jgi:hypothetical protein
MSITTKRLQIFATAVLLGLGFSTTGCRSDRTAGQAINDKMTAFNVNHALNSDPVLKFPDVKVNVFNGNAQLTGFVNNDEQRIRAAEIAAGVQGVSQVINEISLKPTPTGRAEIRDPLRGDDRNLTPPPVNPPPPPR